MSGKTLQLKTVTCLPRSKDVIVIISLSILLMVFNTIFASHFVCNVSLTYIPHIYYTPQYFFCVMQNIKFRVVTFSWPDIARKSGHHESVWTLNIKGQKIEFSLVSCKTIAFLICEKHIIFVMSYISHCPVWWCDFCLQVATKYINTNIFC